MHTKNKHTLKTTTALQYHQGDPNIKKWRPHAVLRCSSLWLIAVIYFFSCISQKNQELHRLTPHTQNSSLVSSVTRQHSLIRLHLTGSRYWWAVCRHKPSPCDCLQHCLDGSSFKWRHRSLKAAKRRLIICLDRPQASEEREACWFPFWSRDLISVSGLQSNCVSVWRFANRYFCQEQRSS